MTDLICPAGLPEALVMQLIDVREIALVAGVPAIHWRLLTTRPVADAAGAWGIVDLYRRRWAIEQLFRTLKSQGFDIEGIKIEEPQPRALPLRCTPVNVRSPPSGRPPMGNLVACRGF